MICIHPVASAILIVDCPTNPGQEDDEKVALFKVLKIGRAGIGCFHIFFKPQLLRSCHDRIQTISYHYSMTTIFVIVICNY